jgi:hypothetical protein
MKVAVRSEYRPPISSSYRWSNKERDIEGNVVSFCQDRYGIGADLIGYIPVRCDPIGADDAEMNRLASATVTMTVIGSIGEAMNPYP